MNKRQLINITENVIKRLVNEGLLTDEDDENMTPYDEYLNNYPNSDFNPENISRYDVLKYCKTSGDFPFIDNYFWKVGNASNSETKEEIINELINTNVFELTRDYDYLIEDIVNQFYDYYVAVFKIKDSRNKPYGIIYLEER